MYDLPHPGCVQGNRLWTPWCWLWWYWRRPSCEKYTLSHPAYSQEYRVLCLCVAWWLRKPGCVRRSFVRRSLSQPGKLQRNRTLSCWASWCISKPFPVKNCLSHPGCSQGYGLFWCLTRSWLLSEALLVYCLPQPGYNYDVQKGLL